MASKSLGTLTVDLIAKTAGFVSGMDKAERRLDKTKRTIRDINRTLAGFGIALGGAFSVATIKNIVDAGLQMERFERALKVATGTASGAAKEMQFVTNVSNQLGLSLADTASSYSRLTAAARGTALQGQAARDIFVGISEASTVLGLSAEQTGGALTAIEQIISKGKVSAEELRGQLGERLPGAFQIAARAVGVTTSELGDMLKKGELLAEDLLPALSKELHETFGPQTEEAADSAQAAFNRLNNAILQLKVSIAESGFTDFLAEVANRAASVIGPDSRNELQQVADELGNAYKELENARRSGAVQDIALLEQEIALLRDKFTELQAISRIESQTGGRNDARGFAAIGSIGETSKQLDEIFAKQLKDYEKGLESFASSIETAEDKAASMREELNRFRDDLTAGQVAAAESSIFDVLTSGIEEIDANFESLRKKESDFFGGKRLKDLADANAKELEQVREFLATREAIEAEAYARRADILLENLDAGSERDALLLENAQRYADTLIRLEEETQERITQAVLNGTATREQIENASGLLRAQAVVGRIQQMTAGLATANRTMFEINKAAAIAGALLSAKEAIVDSYQFGAKIGGPALGAAFAAAAATATAAQVAAVKATSFGGGTTPSAVGSTPVINGHPIQEPSAPEARERSQIVEIHVNGSLLTDDALVKKLGDLFDSDAVIVGPNSRQASVIRTGTG